MIRIAKILTDGNTRVCRLFNPLSLYHPSTSVMPLMQVSHDGYIEEYLIETYYETYFWALEAGWRLLWENL